MLTTIGLLLDFLGVIVIFIWGPPAPKVMPDGSELIWAEATPEGRARACFLKYMSRAGLALIGMGFFLQLVGNHFAYQD